MRIAQVAPLYESVPPRLYGGTERVVSYLTEALVQLGHDVTLFASGDSRTSASLVSVVPSALRLTPGYEDHLSPHVLMLEDVARHANTFDVVHFHITPFHLPVARRLGRVPHVTTQHGRLDLPGIDALYREYDDVPLVSISDAQRTPVPHALWVGTVHHGLPEDLLPFHGGPGEYLAFLGRISREKRVDRAIAIATACRMPLRVAAKVDPADRVYFEECIRPLLDNPWVEFIGEIDERQKSEFLGHARALLFPIDWPEPFGLVMIEALACGTPVVAFRGGSVEEVIEHGRTGFVVDSIPGAVEAVAQTARLERRVCRESFERRFTAARMAAEYVQIYGTVTTRPGDRPVIAPADLGVVSERPGLAAVAQPSDLVA